MTTPSYGPENPRPWDPNDPTLTATTGVIHEAGGVLRASKTYKGETLLKLLNKSQHKVVLEMARDQEQERVAVAAGRTVWSGTVKEGTK